MSLSSRLSRFLQAGFKLNKLTRLHNNQNAGFLKLDVNCNDSASLVTGCRRLCSTEPKLSEGKVAAEIYTGATTDVTEELNANDKREDFTLLSGLKSLDDQVKRIGRVDLKQVKSLIRRCKKGMSSAEALMLIRCCGNLLVKEAPQERKVILEETWKKVTACCPDITTDIINAMMAVKIENFIGFKPSEELASLQQNNCAPNKMTFELMMSQYCEAGDVVGAIEVLNHMKLLGLPINLTSMHHLIKGYGKNGDFEEANNLISTMSQHKLRPTADTYTALMVGYAEKGNLDGIKEVMTTVAAKNIVISLSNVYEIILKLAVSGHSEKTEEVLDILVGGGLHKHGDQFRSGHQRKFDYQDTLNVLYQLLASGQYDAIKFVLKKAVANGIIYEEAVSNISNGSIIGELIKKGKPPKEVLMVRDALVKERMLNPEFELLAEWALHHQNPDYVLELFAELKDMGMLFKPHYFWPLFNKAKRDKNVEDIYKITKFFDGTFASSKSSTITLIDWSFEALKNLGQKPEEILSNYEKLELSEWVRDVIEVSDLMKEGKFQRIREMIENGHQFSVNFMLSNLSEGINKSKNLTELMELIKIMQDKLTSNLKVNSSFLSKTIQSFKGESEDLNKFIQSWVDNELKFEAKLPVITEARKRIVNEELLEKLAALLAQGQTLKEFNSPLLKDLNLKDLPNAVKSSDNKNMHGKKLESESLVYVKSLLKKRENREVQKALHELSEKGDIESLKSLEKLNLPKRLSTFFDKCVFVGHIQSGKAKEFISTLTDGDLTKFISLNVLNKLAVKEPEVFAQLEKMLEKPVEEMKFISPYASLYLHYLISNNEQKINNFLQLHPTLKSKIFLDVTCRQAKFDKNETLLRLVIKIHKDKENPRRVVSAYNSLILIKCEAKDCQVALDIYNEALSSGLTFDDFSIRALQSLQAQLQGNNLPLPWKEGDVEKKAQKAAMDKDELSSSDSDSD